MHRYWTIVIGVSLLFLGLFFLGSSLGLDLDSFWVTQQGYPTAWTAFVGVSLLIVDVFLPVPSSLVLVGLGAVFGPLYGAALGFLGTCGGGLVAFMIGRLSRHRLMNFIGDASRSQTDALLGRWGFAALALSRPMPILAETTAIMAGASQMTFGQAVLGISLGCGPMSVLLAMTGASVGAFDQGWHLALAILIVSSLAWGIGRYMEVKIHG